jgi:hypothetical protein
MLAPEQGVNHDDASPENTDRPPICDSRGGKIGDGVNGRASEKPSKKPLYSRSTGWEGRDYSDALKARHSSRRIPMTIVSQYRPSRNWS